MAVKNQLLKDSLQEHYYSVRACDNCHYCKWVPLALVKSQKFAPVCPSVDFYNFHSHSLAGKLPIALSAYTDRIECSDRLLDVVYRCMTDGGCDVSCKVCRHNMEPLEALLGFRAGLVAEGHLLPQHMPIIESLHKNDNTMEKPKADRANWAEGLGIKNLTSQTADVMLHVGCRLSYDESLWKVNKALVNILDKAKVDFGSLGKDEECCGSKAYDMGYRGELTKYAESKMDAWKNAGVKTVVTACAHCYEVFVRRYPMHGFQPKVQVYHMSQYLEKLIGEGKITLNRKVPLKVTYHDPCHLGRRGEPFIPWNGTTRKIKNQIIVHDPPKPIYRGNGGEYDAPRNLINAITPGGLVEMERTREHAWCCGAGGGVKESYPDFSLATASKRIVEAKATGAEAIVTACPWCESNFNEAINQNGDRMQVFDVLELVNQAI